MQIGAKVMPEKKKAEVWASFNFAHGTIVSFIAVSELLVLECSTCMGGFHLKKIFAMLVMLPYTLHGTQSGTLRLVNSRTIWLSKQTKKRITRD
jgi:hypothetical protein